MSKSENFIVRLNSTCKRVFTTSKGEVQTAPTRPPTLQNKSVKKEPLRETYIQSYPPAKK